jgi:hypothetical protein
MGAPWSEGTIPTAEARDRAGQEHWAFRPVREVAPPAIRGGANGADASPIDAFIFDRLAREGLTLSPRADRRTLIRRATFDLTGLPPTPAEVAAFEADPAPDAAAFAAVVDRLLASPAYGERWGRYWLDVARYGDSKGYVAGKEERRYPYAYTYRDYVIRSFNEDKPYDRFLVEQVAADRLDRLDDRRDLAALGFLTVGRRFLNDRNEIIDDRIDVVCRGLLGLTVACARCHDHKFDPIPTDDYYSLYGVFASTVEPEDLPLIGAKAAGAASADYERQFRERSEARDAFLARHRDEIQADFRSRIAAYLRAGADLDFNPGDAKLDERARADGLPPERLRGFSMRWRTYFAATKPAHDPVFVPWHAFAALPADGFAEKAAELAARPPDTAAEANPIVARSFAEAPPASMAEVVARYGTLLAEAESRWRGRLKADPTAKALDDKDWEELRQVLYDDDGPATVATAAAPQLFDGKVRDELTKLRARIAELQVTHPGAPPRAMVVNDAPNPTDPRVFIRGNPGRPGKAVPRRFLEVLSGPDRKPFADGGGRLDLARAIARPDNPLTARVLVNRLWLNHFGAGLVGTPSDFGLRSDPPTHPELLDYLAAEFVRGGWSIKAMHRKIMLTAVYQQRSDNRPEGLARDPQNRLLWKFNRRRLDFEATRDALLAVSGRLDPTLGGRSVFLTTAPFTGRRTVYGLVDRQNLDGLYRTFDFASPDATSPQRYVTTVPQQALFLMNSPFVIEQSRRLVERLESAPADAGARVRQLYRLLFGRAPEPHELELGVAFAGRPAEPVTPARVTDWQYGYGGFDTSSGRVGRFEPFPHWTGSAWQFDPNVPDPKGDFLFLSDEGGHPGCDAEHAAIRRWVAPRDAVITIEATLRHGSNQGNGVLARIVSGGKGELGSWVAHNARVSTRVEKYEVKRGETIDFVVDCRQDQSSDSFSWSPRIRAEGPSPNMWDARSDFQGPPPTTLTPWEAYAQVLLLTNEFAFVD